MAFFGFGKKKEQEQAAQEQSAKTPANAPASEPAADEQEDEKKKGLFSRLWQGLSKTRTNVAGRMDELIEATEEIDDDFFEDLVDILIMSDMGVRTSDRIIEELKKRIEERKITDARKARVRHGVVLAQPPVVFTAVYRHQPRPLQPLEDGVQRRLGDGRVRRHVRDDLVPVRGLLPQYGEDAYVQQSLFQLCVHVLPPILLNT